MARENHEKTVENMLPAWLGYARSFNLSLFCATHVRFLLYGETYAASRTCCLACSHWLIGRGSEVQWRALELYASERAFSSDRVLSWKVLKKVVPSRSAQWQGNGAAAPWQKPNPWGLHLRCSLATTCKLLQVVLLTMRHHQRPPLSQC